MIHEVISNVIVNRKVTLFVAILLVIVGLYSYNITPKEDSPEIELPAAIVTAVYPGASPEDVEKLVTKRIEDKIVQMDGYDYCASYSRNSISVVVFELEYGIDIDKAWTALREKMGELENELPEGARILDINTNVMEVAGIMISMSGEGYSYEELEYYAEEVKKRLGSIYGIAQFDIEGKQSKEIKVELDAAKLNNNELSYENILNVIRAQNFEIPSGSIDDGKAKINVKVNGMFKSLKEIEDTIIGVSKESGEVLRLKDVARVYVGLEDSNYKIKHNGKNAILLTGYFKKDKNIIHIGEEVEKQINEIRKELPSDISFNEVIYKPKDISNSLNGFIQSLLMGMLLVILITFISMGFKNAIIVSTAIPLTVVITFISMNVIGIKFHQISITALIIALGMLVDNAIVFSDSIQGELDAGTDRLEACVKGARDVAIPVLSSTLTTVGAFIPLALIQSAVGQYIISIPQIIMLSLTFSYLVALLFIPTMAFIFFKVNKGKQNNSHTRMFFANMLGFGLKYKKTTLMFVAVALVLSGFLATNLRLQFFPKADKNILYIDIKEEQGTDILKTEQIADEVSKILSTQPEIIESTVAIGRGLPKFWSTMPISIYSPDFAQILIKVNLNKQGKFKTNSQFADHLQEIFDKTISSGTVTVKQLEQSEPVGAPITARLSGDDIQKLATIADELCQTLNKIDGTINVRNDSAERVYEYSVDIDTDIASSLGISKYDVQKEVRIALGGQTVYGYRQNSKEYNILVKGNITSNRELENLAVKSSVTGEKVLLKQIANISLKAQVPTIVKYDRNYTVSVFSDVKSGISPVAIQSQLKNHISNMDLNGVDIKFDGEQESIDRSFGDVGVKALIAVMIIFLILLMQFNSFSQPIIILLTIPLSAIGSIIGLFLSRQPLSFTGLLGIVSLFGIVVNNAIILIDFINRERKDGKSISESCASAVEKRIRPIMLTTTTTVIGLVPLIFMGSDLFTPMAVSLASGLIVSTLLTLVIVPIVYSILESKKEKIKRRFFHKTKETHKGLTT